jgi:predicted PurR-regulated permease PerM
MNSAQHLTNLTVERLSFAFIVTILGAVAYYGMGTPFVTILFGYLIIHYLGKVLSKTTAIVAFSLVVAVLFYLFGLFIAEAASVLPAAVNKAVPTVADYLFDNGVVLPFTDSEELRKYILEGVKSQIGAIAKFAQVFTKEFVYVIIALVAVCGIFSTGYMDLGRGTYAIENNLYSSITAKITKRFSTLFESFRTVMGAQVVISAVNTFFTGVFLLLLSLFDSPMPYSFVIVVITFLCGLLPIVGNLISNAVIFSIGLTQSAKLAVIALLYLIILHKFEYFLNSRIIGGRIKNPMWLTLLGLLVGERLGGVPGMIMAPVVLNYLKLEGSRVPVESHISE